jgi:adenine-specific DNA-methyltransferase
MPALMPPSAAETSAATGQQALWGEAPTTEHPAYLSQQLITCIGNKRNLLGPIGSAVALVKKRLGKERLRILDAFCGSGVVSRFFKAHSELLISNDLEAYAAATARCFLHNRSTVDWAALHEWIEIINARVAQDAFEPGFIAELYAPADERHITPQDRVFYTKANARRLDGYRQCIGQAPAELQDLFLGPLLSEASVHANTAGVFKGFYKDRHTGIGQYGGSHRDALSRITARITLEPPVLSCFECEHQVVQGDANLMAQHIRDLDLAYIDPPYNQHPYGSNYFMLNLLVHYRRPARISTVSGIPADWQRSGYNVRSRALPLLHELLTAIDAPFLLVSFNNEGFIPTDAMLTMLGQLGSVQVFETRYNTFRGSRNLKQRALHVTEQLFLVERS